MSHTFAHQLEATSQAHDEVRAALRDATDGLPARDLKAFVCADVTASMRVRLPNAKGWSVKPSESESGYCTLVCVNTMQPSLHAEVTQVYEVMRHRLQRGLRSVGVSMRGERSDKGSDRGGKAKGAPSNAPTAESVVRDWKKLSKRDRATVLNLMFNAA
jgi:hypothetical protein